MRLTDLIPSVEQLLALSPADVAPIALRVLHQRAIERGHVHSEELLQEVHGPPGDRARGYPENRAAEAKRALEAAWHWMTRNGLLIPQAGANHTSGWHSFSEDAHRIAKSGDVASFIHAAHFPKELLHPSFADDVWREIMRGEYDNAVLKCFRAIEEAVRKRDPSAPRPYGAELMRHAFGPGGPLHNATEVPAEAEALAHLFAGAIGRFKNPQSHRSVGLDGTTARELAVFATFLMRIIESRP